MSTTLDRYLHPSAMRISHHAKQRYLERRGWPQNHENLTEADTAIRELLERVAHKAAPLTIRPGGRVCRRYKVGELVFVLTEDGSTVITMYHKQPKHHHPKRSR